MPNRIIREGILSSERVNSLSPNAELFYRRLMSVVDDFGRYSANPSLLRASCYPLQLDVVKEDSIKKHLAACADAGLIVLFTIADKAYLEMQDFRQQVRAKESKYPSPDGVRSSSDQPATSGCVADDAQATSGCVADAHVDGGGDVDEDVYLQPPPHAHGEDPFSMRMDWEPSKHFSTLAKQAMLPMPGGEMFAACLAEFRSYWLSNPTRKRTQHEWDHALIKSLKSEKARGGFSENARASPPGRSRSSIHDQRAETIAALTGAKRTYECTNAEPRDITAESTRVA